MSKIKKIVVDRNICIGAASCVISAGTVFELDGENKAVIKLKDGSKNSGPVEIASLEDAGIADDMLMMAAESCPTRAISLFDENDTQTYPL